MAEAVVIWDFENCGPGARNSNADVLKACHHYVCRTLGTPPQTPWRLYILARNESSRQKLDAFADVHQFISGKPHLVRVVNNEISGRGHPSRKPFVFITNDGEIHDIMVDLHQLGYPVHLIHKGQNVDGFASSVDLAAVMEMFRRHQQQQRQPQPQQCPAGGGQAPRSPQQPQQQPRQAPAATARQNQNNDGDDDDGGESDDAFLARGGLAALGLLGAAAVLGVALAVKSREANEAPAAAARSVGTAPAPSNPRGAHPWTVTIRGSTVAEERSSITFPSNGKYTIERADYGTWGGFFGSKCVDVTAIVRNSLAAQSFFHVSNESCGCDPNYGKAKQLRVEYSRVVSEFQDGGHPSMAMTRYLLGDGMSAELPATSAGKGSGSLPQVVSATYGGPTRDITSHLQRFVAQYGRIVVNCDHFGGDPLPGVPKFLFAEIVRQVDFRLLAAGESIVRAADAYGNDIIDAVNDFARRSGGAVTP